MDVGIKDVAVTSDGFFTGAPRYSYRYHRKLKRAQRKLACMQKGSNHWRRQRLKVARLHEKIANSRQDFLRKRRKSWKRSVSEVKIFSPR
ncbi:transposase [Methylomarinum roseum]|uniref:transposase n=1 Tax=Methylomarinum roseum TaxID=3067653 RepID=UPI00273CA0F9|nr:transposase [Methylomarinum sp. Ch1-1]MDP4523237.1 transposase [Methylomarinum sp. Ch1-1]